MDVPLQVLFVFSLTLLYCVSILVLMDVPLQVKIMPESSSDNHVSILVLMDVPLQGDSVQNMVYAHESFNPCFNGCTSSSSWGNL